MNEVLERSFYLNDFLKEEIIKKIPHYQTSNRYIIIYLKDKSTLKEILHSQENIEINCPDNDLYFNGSSSEEGLDYFLNGIDENMSIDLSVCEKQVEKSLSFSIKPLFVCDKDIYISSLLCYYN